LGQNRLCPNQRISGSVGEFSDGPSKRHHQQQWFGYIVRAAGEKKYQVRFDIGEERECASNILKVEHIAASLPSRYSYSYSSNVREQTVLETSIDEVEADAAEVEDLPEASTKKRGART
jgi:hypothetical protein